MSTMQEKPDVAPANGQAKNGQNTEQPQAELAVGPRPLADRVAASVHGHAASVGNGHAPEITGGIEFRGAPKSFTFRGVK